LEKNWEVVKKEFLALQESLFHPWPEANLYKKNGIEGEGWDVFGLYAFGKKHYKNSKLCPETTKIVEKIPGMSTAAFSILNPGARIVPHVGYYGYSEMVLRCHLGLIVPPEELCWLQVGQFKQSWEEGKTLVFDDTYTHSAVNNSDLARVILLLDFNGGPRIDDKNSDISEPTADQSDYLDMITAKYGYGIKDEVNLEEKVKDEQVNTEEEIENSSKKKVQDV